MELQEFVRTTIAQIVNGVMDAQKDLHETRAVVAPEFRMYDGTQGQENRMRIRQSEGWLLVHEVEFDVAVSASEKTTTGGAARLQILEVLSIGGNKGRAQQAETVSRVRFTVPVALPGHRFTERSEAEGRGKRKKS
ncbi:MAG: hypothetical protein IPN34_20940 [Planctomycetes bacterium]|nr:hypothetical protein [Planctomycetota bacterium]